MIELKGKILRERFIEYADYCVDGFIPDEKLDTILKTFEENKTGILLCGNPGGGKTMTFKILQKIVHPQDVRHFKIKSCVSIVAEYNREGHEIFNESFFSKNTMWDDFGMESKGKYYGNTIEVMQEIIFTAYERFKDGHRVSFTSMNTDRQIEQRYGAWVMSRLREMCEIIPIKHNNDYRLKRNFKSFPPVKYYKIKDAEDLAIEKYYRDCAEKPFPPTTGKTLGQILKEQFGTPPIK